MSELVLVQARPDTGLVRSRAGTGGSELSLAVSRAEPASGARTRTSLATVQTRLLVGPSHDAFEHEADRTADAVTEGRSPSLPSPLGLLRLTQSAVAKDEPPRKDDEPEKKAQKLPSGSGGAEVAPAGIEAGILGQLGGGFPLDASLRAAFEPRFGYEFAGVRVHTGPAAAGAASALGARAFTVGQNVFFGAGEYRPDSHAGRHLIAHELTHTIQQTPAAIRPVRLLRAAPMVQRWEGPIDRVRSKIANFLEQDFPPWELITLLIGRDPVRDRPVKGSTRDWIHAAMKLAPDGQAMFDRLDEEGEIDAVAQWWDGEIAELNLTLDGVLALVGRAWDAVGISDLADPVGAWNNKIKPIFAPTAQRVWTFIKNVATKIFQVIRDVVLNQVGAWAKQQKGYPLLTMVLGRDPVTGEAVTPTLKGVIFAVLDLVPGGEQIKENLEKAKTVEKAAAWFKVEVKKLDLTWEGIKLLFSKAWNAIRITDLLDPVGLLEKMWAVFRPLVIRLITFLVAVGKKVLEFVFEGAMIIAGPIGVQIVGIVRKIGTTFQTIVNDPVAFLRHLANAVKKGVEQFSKHIWDHLKNGVIAWLAGTLEGAGLILPKVWDLRGILDLTLQFLGITYPKIRVKLVKALGEKTVAMLEEAFAFVKTLIVEGPAAAWREIVAAIGSLWDLVIGGIQDWAVTKIVTAAITKLATMFNPVGAVIQAIITTYNTIAFFIERIKQILAFVEAVVDSIANIAAGKIAQAANYVEQAMARSIPVLLGFMARLINLGDVSGAIKKVITSIQDKVDKAIDAAIAWIVAKAKQLFGIKEKDAPASATVSKEFTMAGEGHTIAATGQDKDVRVTIASGPAKRLHDTALAAQSEVHGERPPRPEPERGYILTALGKVVADSAEKEIWYEWHGTGEKGDFQSFLVLKVDKMIQDLASLSPFGIKSLDDLFKKVPGSRKLPEEYQSGDWVRENLYASSSEWGPKQAKIVARDKPKIKQKVADANARKDVVLWSTLIGGVPIGKYIPESAELGKFLPAHVDSVAMSVDHIEELADHWQRVGHNSADDVRQRVALDDENNLELVTVRYNSSKKHGSYTPFVDEKFESKKRNSTVLDRKIAGRFFLRADGSELK